MSSSDEALERQEAEAQVENPYTFEATPPTEAPRAVLEDMTASAHAALDDMAREIDALGESIHRIRRELNAASGAHVADALVLRSGHAHARMCHLRDCLALLCASYERQQTRLRPF